MSDIFTAVIVRVHQPEAADATSHADQAYYRIRELIVTLALAPGSALNERDLMERVGLGRTPIREALRTLARDKLVDIFPRRGIFVSRVDVGDLAGLAELRRELEGYCARVAAERATPADRAGMEQLLAELDAPGHDERSLIELDQRIHRHVHRCAHNPFLEATLEECYFLNLRIWLLALERVRELGDAVQEHRDLLSAILAGDPARAEAVMRRHVTSFERAIRNAL